VLIILKFFVVSILVIVISELSKKDVRLSALLLALPIIPFITYLIIWLETKDTNRIATLALENMIYVLPVIPCLFFLAWNLKRGLNFFLSILLASIVLVIFYLIIQKIFMK